MFKPNNSCGFYIERSQIFNGFSSGLGALPSQTWCIFCFSMVIIQWIEVFGGQWLEDVGFINRSESPTALVQIWSTLEVSNRLYRNTCNMFSRHGLMVLWFSCVMAGADDTSCALQKAQGKPKIQDNDVYFLPYKTNTVESVDFDATSHMVTQGQPYEGVFTLGYYLDVRAGRQASEEVARDFNAGITPDNALGLWLTNLGDTGKILPSELNFAVFGTMSLKIDHTTTVCPEMRIAQGHRGMANNWWIAGTKCHFDQETFGLRCPCDPTDVTFHAGEKEYEFQPEAMSSSWKPSPLLIIARKVRVTCAFRCWKSHLRSVEKEMVRQ